MSDIIICDHCKKIIEKDRMDIHTECYNALLNGHPVEQEKPPKKSRPRGRPPQHKRRGLVGILKKIFWGD